MGIARIQVTLPNITGLPEDVFVNTFHFVTPGATVAAPDAEDVFDILESFYNDPHGAAVLAVGEYMSTIIDRPNCTMKAYDLADPEPRTPVALRTWTLVATAASFNYPNEVAVCMSFRGAIGSGDVPARKRGRIFIGPLSSLQGTIVSGDTRPSAAHRTTIAEAGAFLKAQGPAIQWVQYSRTADDGNLVVSGYVDDAFDTQRRRGRDATTRTTF